MEGDSPLPDYYRLLEGCEWAVWHEVVEGKSIRRVKVMLRLCGGDKDLTMAVHFQVVGDEI